MKLNLVYTSLTFVLFFSGASHAAVESEVPAPPVKFVCESDMSKSDRIAVLERVIDAAEAELAKNPDVIKDPEARMRVSTFAAGSIPDSAPFILLDRRCWTYFYEAKNQLGDGEYADSKKTAAKWKNCLVGTLPDRVPLAEPLMVCFDSPQAKAKTTTKTTTKKK